MPRPYGEIPQDARGWVRCFALRVPAVAGGFEGAREVLCIAAPKDVTVNLHCAHITQCYIQERKFGVLGYFRAFRRTHGDDDLAGIPRRVLIGVGRADVSDKPVYGWVMRVTVTGGPSEAVSSVRKLKLPRGVFGGVVPLPR